MARREAELALEDYKNKLRPHFLFNQLNNVYGFLAQDRVEAAQTYIGDLGDYLRSLMGVLDRTFATVEEEMAALGGFVLLQQQASYDHVNFRTEISSSVKNALVPSGILQPLVENGFKYAGKASQKGAYIKIVAQQVGKVLEIVVEDSGYGETVRKGGTGHGLTMLEERFASYAKSSRKPGQWKVEKDFGKQKSTVKLTMPFRT
jgi:LytS/YehU family sensor histidine kinase